MSDLRILVAEGNSGHRCVELTKAGACGGAECHERTLEALFPGIGIEMVNVADPDSALPSGVDIDAYDGVILGGSALHIPDADSDPRVRRQIDFAAAVFETGAPFFGSCWGFQVAVAAAGGLVAASPRGRELGLARKITLTDAGRSHPMYEGKASVFDGPAVHMDEVTHLPSGGVVLASNAHSAIQAAMISHAAGTFWGVQYHPEFDLDHMAGLFGCYAEGFVKAGFFADEAAAHAHAEDYETLHNDPERQDLAWLLGIDDDVLDLAVRTREIANWINRAVLPRKAGG